MQRYRGSCLRERGSVRVALSISKQRCRGENVGTDRCVRRETQERPISRAFRYLRINSAKFGRLNRNHSRYNAIHTPRVRVSTPIQMLKRATTAVVVGAKFLRSRKSMSEIQVEDFALGTLSSPFAIFVSFIFLDERGNSRRNGGNSDD